MKGLGVLGLEPRGFWLRLKGLLGFRVGFVLKPELSVYKGF